MCLQTMKNMNSMNLEYIHDKRILTRGCLWLSFGELAREESSPELER